MISIRKIFQQFFSSKVGIEQEIPYLNKPGFVSQGAKIDNAPPPTPPSALRPFNYERIPEHPWVPHSGYQNIGYDEEIKRNVRVSTSGREWTDHAITATLPSGTRYSHSSNDPNDQRRSISPRNAEYVIGYGEAEVDKRGRLSYVLDEVRVSVSEKGRIHGAYYQRGGWDLKKK